MIYFKVSFPQYKLVDAIFYYTKYSLVPLTVQILEVRFLIWGWEDVIKSLAKVMKIGAKGKNEKMWDRKK